MIVEGAYTDRYMRTMSMMMEMSIELVRILWEIKPNDLIQCGLCPRRE